MLSHGTKEKIHRVHTPILDHTLGTKISGFSAQTAWSLFLGQHQPHFGCVTLKEDCGMYVWDPWAPGVAVWMSSDE